MTDLHRGYDLTSVLENVAQAHYERQRAEIIRRSGGTNEPPPWEEWSSQYDKTQVKQSLLPLVTDVIEQLEEHQPGRVAMRPYGFDEASLEERKDPRFYENQPAQRDPETATVWTLHLNPPSFMVNIIIERMSTYPEVITGEFVIGTSWQEWSERPPLNEDDVHLQFYYRVHDKDDAVRVGNFLHAVACFAANVEDMNFSLCWAVDDR